MNYNRDTIKMTKAVYALSADPITYGHINVIERASKMFDIVYIAIGTNPDKKYLFSDKKRLFLAQESLKKHKNVKVYMFEGMLVDFAIEHGIKTIVRGIRNLNDMDYEKTLHLTNKNLYEEIETICLFSDKKLDHVSSSAVRSIQKEYGSVVGLVPSIVKVNLEKKMSNQFIVGVTGIMGSGKTYIANKLVEHGKSISDQYRDRVNKQAEAFVSEIRMNVLESNKGDNCYTVHNIELDDVAKDILYDAKYSEKYSLLRRKVKENFGTNKMSEMADILFSSQENIDKMRHLIYPYISSELRLRTRGLKGVILINSATLIESEMLKSVSNQLMLIETADKFRQVNLQDKRGYSPEDTNKRLDFVYSVEEKERLCTQAIEDEGYGFLMKIDGKKGSEPEYIKKMYDRLLNLSMKDI
jgi:pantetheine-phosphate adenylyltransferase